MADLSKLYGNDLLTQLLPPYGTEGTVRPIWDEGQKMFICDQHESASGHLYYRGVRFCENIVIVEHVGLYHNWTYIDGIDLYAFNGTKLNLVQKRDYDKQFREEEFIRAESEKMVQSYFEGALKFENKSLPAECIASRAKTFVDSSYRSFLSDDFNIKLTQIFQQLEQANYGDIAD